jgi:FtsH-binding integral membrane protein
MPRNVQQPTPWFRRFMVVTGLVILICAVIAFNALRQSNFAVAFPLFVGIVILIGFEVVLMFLHNRTRT